MNNKINIDNILGWARVFATFVLVLMVLPLYLLIKHIEG